MTLSLKKMTCHQNNNMAFEQNGLNFILSHFEKPLFPRTMSTYRSEGKQLEVFSKEEIIKAFEQSDFIDCRVNAYRSYTEYKGINRQAPNFVFIDLDSSIFETQKAHKLALSNTLRNIKEKLAESCPTVIWSGNGYHIYQPIEAFVLEEEEIFSTEFDQPSRAFLKFAEQYLSDNKSDPSHNPSFKSCMTRIPGTFNYKCILEGKDPEVRIIQRWNRKKHLSHINDIKWIELLLETPIPDYRKNAISLILAPYLINVKKLTYDDAFNIIKDWLNKCDSIKRLDSN